MAGVVEGVVEALAAVVGHRVGRIADERDTAAVVIPLVVRQARVPVAVGRVVDRFEVVGHPVIGAAHGVSEGAALFFSLAEALARAPAAFCRLGVLLRGAGPPRDVEGEGPGLGPVRVGAVERRQHAHHAVRVHDQVDERVRAPQVQRLLPREAAVDEGRGDGEAVEARALRAQQQGAHAAVAAVCAEEQAAGGAGAVGEVRRHRAGSLVRAAVADIDELLAPGHVDVLSHEGPEARANQTIEVVERDVADDLPRLAVDDWARVARFGGRVGVGLGLDDASPFLLADERGEDGVRPLASICQ